MGRREGRMSLLNLLLVKRGSSAAFVLLSVLLFGLLSPLHLPAAPTVPRGALRNGRVLSLLQK